LQYIVADAGKLFKCVLKKCVC